ncbi:VWA domain-containing protein [Corynebacterium sp. p3-SID1145]|uniref:vWA domain-containing protein n=1 Tax=unclassified Corynebacterium TaxID=2624378 RepID=UPI0021A9F6E7|nr:MULTISPECIES: VWA domain-containing protein [unclassified Corynebacterium]MCT1453332.1 VWA domain-containing protein [Corynebacterium sp. p3-SID1145]MCT1462401.1 VWA domain-containing protein [Corynebacterium sp. p3-SID1140]
MSTTRTFSLSFVSVLFVAALLGVSGFVVPGDAGAQHGSGESSAAESSSTEATESAGSNEATVDSKAALVLDASFSMSEADVGGGSRMDAAKKASHDLVNSLPEQANLGLLAYGMRESNTPDNRERGCQDIETLVPVGKSDKGLLNSKIDEMSPKGYTPVGNSLKAAAKELGDSGERTIILVSDGIDTCAPPPVCEVAKELAGDGFDLTIHTVGFKTDEEARKELECVAEAGGGEFMEADDAGSLAESVKFLAQRDAETYQTAGTEFEYSDTPEDAKWLGEGRYHTTVNAKLQKNPGDKVETGYYKVAIPEGHNAVISTTVLPKRSTSGRATDARFTVRRADPINGVEKCEGSYGGAYTEIDGKTSGSAAWMPEPLIRRIQPVEEERGCGQQWTIPDQIAYENASAVTGRGEEEVDVEVEINFEPIPDDSEVAGYPDAVDTSDDGPQLDFGGAQDIKGGSSFSEAVEVKPGAYKDAIVPGEYRFYKIPVEYGQRPVFSYRSLKSQDGGLGNLSPMLYSPFRQNIKYESTRPEATLAGNVINFRNRETGSTGAQQANAGYYYVGLGMPQGDADKVMGVEQPFEIAFDAVGAETDGPDWRPTDKDGPEPSDNPPDTGGKKDGEESDGSEQTQAQEDDGGKGSGARGILIALISAGILAVLAALVAAIVVLRRR